MNKWYFIPTGDGWEWHRTDPTGKLTRSTRSFATRAECVADATASGYSSEPTKAGPDAPSM
jgi:hypothetical protein